jgi:hypothetical protein
VEERKMVLGCVVEAESMGQAETSFVEIDYGKVEALVGALCTPTGDEKMEEGEVSGDSSHISIDNCCDCNEFGNVHLSIFRRCRSHSEGIARTPWRSNLELCKLISNANGGDSELRIDEWYLPVSQIMHTGEG